MNNIKDITICYGIAPIIDNSELKEDKKVVDLWSTKIDNKSNEIKDAIS